MKISEISEQCNLSADTLRYYERIGLLPPVNRSESGIREYSELDVQRVEFIKCMRSAGPPIEVLLKYFELVQQGDQTMEARKQILARGRTHHGAELRRHSGSPRRQSGGVAGTRQ